MPRPKLMDETQETLRTSAFPCTHVKIPPFLIRQVFIQIFSFINVQLFNRLQQQAEVFRSRNFVLKFAALHSGDRNSQIACALLLKTYPSTAYDLLSGYYATVVQIIFLSRSMEAKMPCRALEWMCAMLLLALMVHLLLRYVCVLDSDCLT